MHDSAGGVIRGAHVQAIGLATRQLRATTTGEQGEYGFPALMPGDFEVHVEAAGFQRIARAVTVQAGTTTRADLVLRVGDLTDSVTVEAASPQIHHDSASVTGLITQDQLQAQLWVPYWGRASGSNSPGTLTKASYTSPDIYDRLSSTEFFGFTGSAEGTIAGQEIRLALNGSLTYWGQGGGWLLWYCRTTDHSVTLRR